jgi:hypothetical protein
MAKDSVHLCTQDYASTIEFRLDQLHREFMSGCFWGTEVEVEEIKLLKHTELKHMETL